jgi:glycosyltransferase involved in cell wall biosynthesis
MLVRRLSSPGGAERSSLVLARALEEEHNVKICGGFGSRVPESTEVAPESAEFGTCPNIFGDCSLLPISYRVIARYVEFLYHFRKILSTFDPDIIFSQHETALVGAWAHSRHDVPHVLFLHDESMIPESPVRNRNLLEMADVPTAPVLTRVTEFIVEHTDLSIANSRFIADKFDGYWGTDSAVVYPFVDPAVVRAPRTGGAILHVNPSRHKGIDITLAVARLLPEHSFILVGPEPDDDVEAEIERRSNVAYLGYVPNIRDVYSVTKLVLMPTRNDEPYGMVPVEAGLSGIPTVHSGRGGLSESADTALSVPSNEASAYVDRIRTVLANYEHYRRRALRHAEDKTAPEQLSELQETVQQRLGIDLEIA